MANPTAGVEAQAAWRHVGTLGPIVSENQKCFWVNSSADTPSRAFEQPASAILKPPMIFCGYAMCASSILCDKVRLEQARCEASGLNLCQVQGQYGLELCGLSTVEWVEEADTERPGLVRGGGQAAPPLTRSLSPAFTVSAQDRPSFCFLAPSLWP